MKHAAEASGVHEALNTLIRLTASAQQAGVHSKTSSIAAASDAGESDSANTNTASYSGPIPGAWVLTIGRSYER